MRIALSACPNPFLASPTAHFPQGLLYLGAALKRCGHDPFIVDLRDRKYITAADIPDCDIVGISATTAEIEWARTISRLAQEKGIKTIIGGAHATFLPEDCYNDFDCVIQGDGELATQQAILDIIGRVSTYQKLYREPLASLAGWRPDWSLIGERGLSKELFTGAGYGGGPLAAGIASSRGCVYRCAFCRSERDKVRFRPIQDVVEEIKGLQRVLGINHFRFYDENFTNPKHRALELYAALEPLKIHIRAHTRSDAWDLERAMTFKRAGGEEMGFGVETASDSVLAKIRKQETVAQHREAIRISKQAGVISKAFWLAGLPGQFWDEINDIKQFMAEERPNKWIVSLFAPYPGSDIYGNPKEYGVDWIDPDWSHYSNFSEEPTISYVNNPKEQIKAQYEELISWLRQNFPR